MEEISAVGFSWWTSWRLDWKRMPDRFTAKPNFNSFIIYISSSNNIFAILEYSTDEKEFHKFTILYNRIYINNITVEINYYWIILKWKGSCLLEVNPLLFERDLAEDVTWLLMMNCKPLRYARETLTTSLNFHLWFSYLEVMLIL